MMDISKARGMYTHFHGRKIKIIRNDGTEWIGMITGIAGLKGLKEGEYEPSGDPAVIFTRIKDRPSWFSRLFQRPGQRTPPPGPDTLPPKGKRLTLRIADIREIHELR